MSSFTLTLSIMILILSLLFFSMDMLILLNLPIIPFSSLYMHIGLILDWMSLLFSASVLLISSMVMIFSNSYIPTKDHKRFSLVLLSFILSMIILILSNNIFFMILGWDGLGLSSYILVIFYMNSKSKESGTITILSNRIGDIMIIISIGLAFSNGIFELLLSNELSSLIILLLITAAFTKSAQFPFSSWLPAAMAAPTPISALVHSSTLVTAGTFLLIRIMNSYHPSTSSIVIIFAILTMMFSGISANWEQDFKKIIALSTLSQMAMIMFAISINLPNLAFFHLITHAFFKSTMFLCAGALIFCSLYQDIRCQGNSSNWSPSLIMSFNITNLSLMGLPFLSGFYSKDAIMEMFLCKNLNPTMLFCALISIGLTTAYSLRLLSFSTKWVMKSSPDKLFFNDPFIIFPIFFILPMSVFMGSALSWFVLPHQFLSFPTFMKISIPLFILIGLFLGSTINYKSKKFHSMGEISSSLWFLNFISTYPTTSVSHLGLSSTISDKTWTEIFSANGSFLLLSSLSKYPDILLKSLLCTMLMLTLTPSLFMS